MEGDGGEMGIGEDCRLPEPLTRRTEGQPGAWGMALAGCRISAAGGSPALPADWPHARIARGFSCTRGADHRHNGPASRQLVAGFDLQRQKAITVPNY